MEYIWLVFLLVIILRSVDLLMKRSDSRGKPGAPRDDGAEDLFFESSPAAGQGESRLELNLPGYLTGRGGDLTTVSHDSGYKERREEPAGERRSGQGDKVDSRRELPGRFGEAELFEGGISRKEFVKGMVWSQILGSRGGIQANKGFKHR